MRTWVGHFNICRWILKATIFRGDGHQPGFQIFITELVKRVFCIAHAKDLMKYPDYLEIV